MTTVPNVNDLVAGDIVGTPAYYVFDPAVNPADDTYTANILDYTFDEKVSVVGASGGGSYAVEMLIDGVDDLLFTGTVDAGYVIPKAVAVECGALLFSQVIDLSAGPMSYGRYLQLGTAAEKTGAYLVTMKGAAFVADLAEMDTFKSIAMVDIASGLAVLDNNIAIRAPYVEIAGGAMVIDEILNYSGDMTIAEGAVEIDAHAVAIFTGSFDDLGKLFGHGDLEIIGGAFSVGEGATVDVHSWLSRGTKATEAQDYIDSTLTFTGDFTVGGDTLFTFYKSSSLTVNSIANLNGGGGTFTMYDWNPIDTGDDTIDVNGVVAKGESFNIGTTDVLVLGDATKFDGIIESMDVGNNATATEPARASGEVALVGIWNFVSAASNVGNTETIITMKDVADGLLAHIAFAGTHAASDYEFFDQIRGVTPTTVIAPTLPPPM